MALLKKRNRSPDNNSDAASEKSIERPKRKPRTTNIIVEEKKMSVDWSILNSKKKHNDLFVSATKTKNYLMDDPFVDWLELYYVKYGLNTTKITSALSLYNDEQQREKLCEENSGDLNILFDKGNAFEKYIFDELKRIYNNDFMIVNITGRDGQNKTNIDITTKAILDGVPIIAQAVMLNNNNNTSGCADLLVRSDYLNKIFKTKILSDDELNIKADNMKQYHYRVVDIKWTTIPLNSKIDTICKQGFMDAYKAQLAIYNCALGNIQGYFPDQTYIMGKGWKRELNCTKLTCSNCFDRLGIIDYAGKDNEIIKKTYEAVLWYREVKKNGHNWSPLDDPKKKHKNMYPNMSNDDMKWNTIKKDIALQIGEPTLISYVGKKERDHLHERGIYSINDKFCMSENMGIKLTTDGGKQEKAIKIDNICWINREKEYDVFPQKIENNDFKWKKSLPTDMFFDYETVNIDFINTHINIYDSSSTTGIIVFMIGVGYAEQGVWKYKSFVMNNITPEEECRCMDEFTKFVTDKTNEIDPIKKYKRRLFHWSQAEISNLNTMNARYDNRWLNWEKDITFVDMYRVFLSEPINIKGSFGYSLKSVGNALFKLGKINLQWSDTDVTNGKNAMFIAAKIYQNKILERETRRDISLMQEIIQYNEVDCKMIYEIVQYFRLNHC